MKNQPPNDRALRWPAVRNIVNVGRTTAWRLIKRGSFPEPFRISPGCVAWSELEIQEWVRARKAG